MLQEKKQVYTTHRNKYSKIKYREKRPKKKTAMICGTI